MGKPTPWDEFRQVFIVLEQGLEGFCNQFLATKTMNSVSITRVMKFLRQSLL